VVLPPNERRSLTDCFLGYPSMSRLRLVDPRQKSLKKYSFVYKCPEQVKTQLKKVKVLPDKVRFCLSSRH
jgi:hypothetical protein